MAERSRYVMRAGFIIHSPNFDDGKIYTNDNLTDDVAERFMAQFPQRKNMFDERPNSSPVAANTTAEKKKRNTRKKKAK